MIRHHTSYQGLRCVFPAFHAPLPHRDQPAAPHQKTDTKPQKSANLRAVPGYLIMTEVEEYLDNRKYPKCYTSDGVQPLGPSVKVCLYQEGVATSAGFDWDYLHRLWPIMEQARKGWVRNAAQPKAAHDRAGYERIVAAGAPAFLGIGFGDTQARNENFCMFGARLQFPASITLAEFSREIPALADLILKLAKALGDISFWSAGIVHMAGQLESTLAHLYRFTTDSARPCARRTDRERVR